MALPTIAKELLPNQSKIHLAGLKAERRINRLTLTQNEASPGNTLTVNIPKLAKNEVIVPGSLALMCKIDLSGGHADNVVVMNVSRALIERMILKLGGQTIDDIQHYNVYKTFDDLWLSREKRDGMILEGIQSLDLNKTRFGTSGKKTSGAEAVQEKVYGKNFRIPLDHDIFDKSGVLYHYCLENQFQLELTLAPAKDVVNGSDPTKLTYKLTDIAIEYEMLVSSVLAKEAEDHYITGKEFPFTHVNMLTRNSFAKDSVNNLVIKSDAQRQSPKAILILFTDEANAGAKDTEKYVFPNITEVEIAIKGKPLMIFNHKMKPWDLWTEAERFFIKGEEHTRNFMTSTKFFAEDKFGLLIDLRTMRNKNIHGSGTRIENDQEAVKLQITRTKTGSGVQNYFVYALSDGLCGIMNKQFNVLQY